MEDQAWNNNSCGYDQRSEPKAGAAISVQLAATLKLCNAMSSMKSASCRSFRSRLGWVFILGLLLGYVSRAQSPSKGNPPPVPKTAGASLTPADAKRFIEQAETRLVDLWIKSQRAS